MKLNIKISNGKTIKLIVCGVKKLTIRKLIESEIIKTKDIVILLINAFFSPFFLAKNEILNIINP
jgi:hypothetical protein